MIYRIKGKIIALNSDTVCLENNGIAWEMHISLYTHKHIVTNKKGEKLEVLQSASDELNQEKNIRLYTWLHSNDKGIALYGFYSLAERSIFLSLQKVSGIGPKAALKILSSTSPEMLIELIKKQDAKSLAKIPGVGTKKASSIILTLEGVYISPHEEVDTEDDNIVSEYDGSLVQRFSDVVNGLIRMGYEKQRVIASLESIKDENPDISSLEEGVLMHNIIMNMEQ